MHPYNEDELLSVLKSDNPEKRKAFSEIVEHYSERLYWYIRKIVISHEDANDVLQNTFIRAWSNITSFRGEAKFSTWLYRIAINESVTFMNRQKYQNNVPLDDSDLLANKLESDTYFDGDRAQKLLQKAILTLPEKQRLVFNMRYYDEMPYEQISAILGTSVGALKSSFHIAMKKVEEYLSGFD